MRMGAVPSIICDSVVFAATLSWLDTSAARAARRDSVRGGAPGADASGCGATAV
jgi:hypothetical protein